MKKTITTRCDEKQLEAWKQAYHRDALRGGAQSFEAWVRVTLDAAAQKPS